MTAPDLYIANAAAAWARTDPVSEPAPGVLRIDTPRTTRYLLTRPGLDALAIVTGTEPQRRVVLEDSFGAPVPELPETVTVKHMPVMLRPAGSITPVRRDGVDVVRVSTLDDLASAEQVIARGFPIEGGVVTGELLPAAVLDVPGLHVWLAYRDGDPAAGAFSYDDGTSVGVYLLATVPEHRSAGLGRAIMTTAVNQNRHRPTTLVATDAGVPLYRSMGFVDVSAAVWYFRMAL
jgi:GNAT superfamily N-acetyltransferase